MNHKNYQNIEIINKMTLKEIYVHSLPAYNVQLYLFYKVIIVNIKRIGLIYVQPKKSNYNIDH